MIDKKMDYENYDIAEEIEESEEKIFELLEEKKYFQC